MSFFRYLLRMRSIIVLIIMLGVLPAWAAYPAEPGPQGVGPVVQAPTAAPQAPVGPEAPPPPKEKPIKVPLTEVIGTKPDALEHIPGSGRVVTQERIFENHRFTINEALREVPGVNIRDEEGFGIRPNIGVRGLDPTRSRKIHIMEDGVPIMLMPYADQSSYYFPPLFRFDRIEILKGSGQLLFGPQNIGGVMNLITRMPPSTPQGNLEVRGGNLSYINTHLDYGGMFGKAGYLVDVTHFQGTTPRFFNNDSKVNDLTFKTVQEISERAAITAKVNYYSEKSNLGYQGLTQQQFQQDPHHTPFTNDNFDIRRVAAHVAHQYEFNPNLTMTTNFFGHYISRAWTRQMQDADGLNPSTCTATVSSTGSLSVGGGCVTGNNLNASAVLALPSQGRFTNDRKYWVYGVEPRFHSTYNLLGFKNEADFGGRITWEESDRKQIIHLTSGIGQSCPGTQTGCFGENNLRHTTAYALYFQNRFFLNEKIIVTPGFRVESINYDQQNRLANGGNGAYAKTWIAEVMPGIGVTYNPVKEYTIFAGFHRGFAPPQISDAVQNDRVVDLDAELSWNYELGVRGNPTHWAGFELTGFRMDFQNQIVTQSVAGGVGATNTNAGRTAHTGLEFATKLDLLDMATGRNREQDIVFDVNYTWVIQAEFRGSRASSITGSALLAGEATSFSTGGKRLPYAPEHLFTSGLSYINRPFGFDARVESQCISDMFGDDRNTVVPTPNGQRGIIRGWCVINASANQYVKPFNTTLFITGKNLFDQLFIVDRSRGIYPGLPLLVQGGAKWTF